ncbi:23S rRNA (uracil(1939)-C(5))-methyltransferase RlmD [uncultured Tissierella sp.]|uniref:23S rRNA (uracil(1939)-C(5))-methyltransferase RlmD n=1 Tax=uncultured Tissierella sp. TaxID=448160 RepID=UPI00280439EC|nr:23S rRNA (uracil(1939)-C(5))-methyltransferase RlmD [uncultured Tissierella sp.]MDU5081288.1 23S rRNA (uracil(1939)-C(5))-methyltransferase RlmD [Bacillota bacterium]
MEINIGDRFEGEIIDFTHEGNGVLKIDNFTVFVAGGLIGDKVVVRIDEIKKNFAIGSVVNITEPSKDRVVLDFDIKEARGGIPLIEYRYSKQLEWKRNKVKMDLAKIAGLLDVRVKDTIGMDNPFRYRNHVQIPVGEKDGKTVIGFYETNSNDIVDMEGSILQPEIGDRILKILRTWMNQYNIKAYDKKTKKGVLRHIGIRINKNNKAMVILVTGSDRLPNEKDLIDMLTKENVISIYQNVNKLNSSITYGKEYKKLYGEDRLLDYIGDYKFYLSPNSFFQVNRTQAEVLYNKAIEYLNPDKDDIIYDLYCGIGTISLYIASNAKKVYGIEIVKEAIEDAKENAILNNIDNAEFIVGKSEEIFPRLMKKGIKGNKIVLDPPRKGCEKEVLEAIVNMCPERIVYVSCNSTTMARDAKYLVENGYKVEEVQPVDMFSHTAHVESLILLQHKNG